MTYKDALEILVGVDVKNHLYKSRNSHISDFPGERFRKTEIPCITRLAYLTPIITSLGTYTSNSQNPSPGYYLKPKRMKEPNEEGEVPLEDFFKQDWFIFAGEQSYSKLGKSYDYVILNEKFLKEQQIENKKLYTLSWEI